MKDKKLINTVIHVPTTEEYMAVTNLASKLGYTWGDGETFNEVCYWNDFKENTCIDIYEGEFASLDYCEKRDYTIKSTQWFLDNYNDKIENIPNTDVFVYYRGNQTRGDEIIKALEDLGGKNKYELDGKDEHNIYFISTRGNIDETNVECGDNSEWLIQHYKKAELPYNPKVKELLWCWGVNGTLAKYAKFYNEMNNATVYSISRECVSNFNYYTPYEG